ncbi:uncharacterized protein N7506_005701 [Penicillium brevicompactum]|uniref:uncharacterized protein n=1 Tax=Penicillium brevicompactum TaxID=5074 RepID=UPI00254217A1|nr:uncharacterized protein N7506_005581 [Penicillium brevicompactum]XP_056811971.1 uncharacterized protein N7506_005701 [Penicillium brevicompactum]KAJ5335645.1 hypothetical protein N7506_005581 [Penicillium brevicompactum]KAJ5335765.1 hypothetical protein N7506_005701 [Penicillium brevicompactum]
MNWGLRLRRAFTLQVGHIHYAPPERRTYIDKGTTYIKIEIGAPRIDGMHLTFPILAGSLETEPAFTPPLKVNSISGFDEAILVGNNLRLNVSVDLKLQGEPGAESERKMKLRWNGTVVIGELEQIMQGDLEGKADFGNPLASFRFDVSEKEHVGLGDRIFVGQGRFVKKEKSGPLNLIYQVSEVCTSVFPIS